jgi:hypothetical protein
MIAASLSHACVRTAVIRHLRVGKLDELFVALLPSLNYSFRFRTRSPVRPAYPVGIKGYTCLAVVPAANTETDHLSLYLHHSDRHSLCRSPEQKQRDFKQSRCIKEAGRKKDKRTIVPVASSQHRLLFQHTQQYRSHEGTALHPCRRFCVLRNPRRSVV